MHKIRSVLVWFFIDEWVAVLEYLNDITSDWELLERYPTAMYASGQQHEVWIFTRNRIV